jgi:hypothetical protein
MESSIPGAYEGNRRQGVERQRDRRMELQPEDPRCILRAINCSLMTQLHASVTGLASSIDFLANCNKTQPNW